MILSSKSTLREQLASFDRYKMESFRVHFCFEICKNSNHINEEFTSAQNGKICRNVKNMKNVSPYTAMVFGITTYFSKKIITL